MASLAWGGQKNGQIPSNRLVSAVNYSPLRAQQKYLTAQSGLLRDDVARQWALMARDCKAATGRTLYLSEGYRSYDSQKKRYDDPKHTAAKAYPGTSGHGWALSTDFNDGDPVVVRWVLANCGKYGFVRTIASEQWHLDFIKAPVLTPASSTATPIPQPAPSEEDDMPLNDADKKWIAEEFARQIKASGGAFIIQNFTPGRGSLLLAGGAEFNLNKEFIGIARSYYPVHTVEDREWDVLRAMHTQGDPAALRALLGLTGSKDTLLGRLSKLFGLTK